MGWDLRWGYPLENSKGTKKDFLRGTLGERRKVTRLENEMGKTEEKA